MGFEISKEIEFDAGHRVPLHESKCKNPHGHRYRVVAFVEGELITKGPESGMVKDFSIVKQLLTERVHDKFDHGFIVAESDVDMKFALGFMDFVNWTDYRHGIKEVKPGEDRYGWKVIIVPFYPTAECLAKSIFVDLKANGLPGLTRIDVWETPTSCASYVEDIELGEIKVDEFQGDITTKTLSDGTSIMLSISTPPVAQGERIVHDFSTGGTNATR